MLQSNRGRNFTIFSLIILVVATLLRLRNIDTSLQYDEIWTLSFYVNKPLSIIFSDLATPNNHPLNTLLMGWTMNGENLARSLRLGALVAGVLGVGAIGYLTYLIVPCRKAILAAMGVIALSPQLILYSQQARGYSLQLFFLIIYAIGVTLIWKHHRLLWGTIANGIGAIGAILTLSTSVLSLAPVGLILTIKAIQTRRFKDLMLLALPALFAIYWYSLNFVELAKGAQVSNSVRWLMELSAMVL